jgi:ABC-type multidrug transport system fused ATPase/permease subunit
MKIRIPGQFLSISRAMHVLNSADRRKVKAVILIQVFLGLLDLMGVIIIGLIGSLTVTGVGSGKPGNKVQYFLEVLNLESKSIQYQAAALGTVAALLLTFKTLCSLYFSRKVLFFLSRRAAVIATELSGKLLQDSLLHIQKNSVQETIYALTGGVNVVTVGIIGATVALISDLSLLIILGSSLFVVDSGIAISTLILFVIIGVLLYLLMSRRAQNLGREQEKQSIEGQELISEILLTFREITVRGRQPYFRNRVSANRLRLANSTAELSFMQNISKYVIEVVVVIGSLLIAAIQFLTQTAQHAAAVIAIFLAVSSRIAPAVIRIQQGLIQLKGNIAAARPTLTMIDRYSSVDSKIQTKEKKLIFEYPGFTPTIEIHNLAFRYPKSKKCAVANLEIKIPAGNFVAIVGPSGAGKSTLADLILGVIEPTHGTIKISGVDCKSALARWAGALSYVPQVVTILDGTILENVSAGFPISEAHENHVNRSLEIAHLSDFVKSLPEGVQTQVGDRGSRLSGGQRQRLGIARAMFTNPKLVVFDEATSSLDGETESSISRAVFELKGKITVITIAHRLSTVRYADQVIYMADGSVRAIGTFEEVRNLVPDFDRQAKLMGL